MLWRRGKTNKADSWKATTNTIKICPIYIQRSSTCNTKSKTSSSKTPSGLKQRYEMSSVVISPTDTNTDRRAKGFRNNINDGLSAYAKMCNLMQVKILLLFTFQMPATANKSDLLYKIFHKDFPLDANTCSTVLGGSGKSYFPYNILTRIYLDVFEIRHPIIGIL